MAVDYIDPSDQKLMNQARAAARTKAAEEAVAKANALADLALSGATTTPSDALRKLTSGGTLTDGERALLNMGPLPRAADTPSYSYGDFRKAEEASNKTGPILPDMTPDTGDGTPTGVTLIKTLDNGDGTFTNVYSDGSTTVTGTKRAGSANNSSTSDALLQQILAQNAASAAAAAKASATSRQSAIDVVTARFKAYGLETLASKIKDLAVDGATEATITLALQETDEYKTRFKANQARLKAGLQVLQPSEYLNLEDGYRQVLRAYGMNQFSTDEYVQKFIENDMSAKELSDRVTIAVQQVQNADPAILTQLKDYYGIGATDAAAYILDPNQQITKIQRQVAAAQIGVAAGKQGLQSNVAVSEQLAAQGITQAEAQKGYATIADILPTAEKLSQIYGDIGTYDQSTAEQEMFNSLASAQRKRQQLTAREVASFSGSSGLARGGLSEGKTAGKI